MFAVWPNTMICPLPIGQKVWVFASLVKEADLVISSVSMTHRPWYSPHYRSLGARVLTRSFIAQYTSPADKGYLVTPTGDRVAPHRGMWYYTIGQGAKLPGMKLKWFVAKKGMGEGGQDIMVVPGP